MKHFPIPVREIARKHYDLWQESDPRVPNTPHLINRIEDAINEAIPPKNIRKDERLLL